MILLLVALLATNISYSQNEGKTEDLKREIQKVSESQKKVLSELEKLRKENRTKDIKINELQSQGRTFVIQLDSIAKVQNIDRLSFQNGIQTANTNISTNLVKMDSRTILGGILLLFTILGCVYLYVKRRNDYTSMSEVRKAQDALQVAQSKMQEESVKLDNQLLSIVQKQLELSALSVNKTSIEPDHSLVVKLANEIARIETNLSKMDKSVRGYKQLVQAKDRMINNVRANGYEIISLLGQEYNDGMQFPTRFVPDDSFPEGKRIITGMIKMQVNYNGKMIQPAEIVVSQNI